MIPESFLKDGIHLDPDGQGIIAEVIYKSHGE
jgi:lysophospholipase L1-like esterase